ncbi:V-type ATP synthase subunit I [Acidianus sp. HS-5]|uniref:V-type ATP synthase subunit I n=1 Tax=Acidianus sp. HS-5 TaxID=2886040 RepID=UPI001F21A191|nr:V-type ATP synthase subunit I [Acidianus sp. HS-5]BDC19686.1 ATP synthase subunit I [Acidianus sp. HS-5]
MILPEKMSRVQILANKELLNDVVTKLLKFQNFEPEEPEEPISNERFEDARRRLGVIQEHLNKFQIIMDLAGVTIEAKGKMKPGDWNKIADEVDAEASKEEDRYKDLLEEIGKIKSELDLYRAQLNEVLPFKDITVDLNKLYNLKLFDIYLLTVLPNQLDKLKFDSTLTLTRKINEKTYAVILISRKNTLQKEKIEKEIGAKVFETPEGKSPYEVYNEVQSKINELTKILEETRAKLKEKLRACESYVKEIYGKLLTIRDALTIVSRARVSEFYVQIEGYAPTKLVKKIKEQLKGEAFITERMPRRYGEKDKPPTLISLPKSIRVIESVVELYGTPSYWEISPIIFLIFTFPILFGLMFPDFGNALVVFLFAVWFYKYGKRKGSENTEKLSLVLIYSSIVAMITGLLAREFFGPVLVGGPREVFNSNKYPVGPLYHIWPVPVSVSNSLEYLIPFGHYSILSTEIEDTMILSIFIGALALFVSSLLGVINAVDKKDQEFLLYEKLPLLILYTVPLILFGYGFIDITDYFGKVECLLGGLLTNIFSFPPNLSTPTYTLAYILILWVEIGLIYNWISKVILIKRHEGHVGLGAAIGMGFIEGGFEAGILLLSNTISFIRILVFALAHYYLLYAFSYMGLLVLYSSVPYAAAVIIAGIIIALGNLLAIALEGLIVFIQDMRLHFYEMFSKFYEGQGRPFMPVMNYVELEEGEKEVARKEAIEVKAA